MSLVGVTIEPLPYERPAGMHVDPHPMASGVRASHPMGIVVDCWSEKSQATNRRLALAAVEAALAAQGRYR